MDNSKILMTADAVGGVWTYALDLARGLARFGTQVTLAVMGPRPDRAQLESAAGIDVHFADYKLEWMENPWSDVDRAGDWLLSLERQIEPDVIHLNGYAHASLPWNAPKLVVAHSCVLSWWEAVHRAPAPAEWDEYRARVAHGIHAADFVVAPSQAMLAAIEKHYGAPRSSTVIPNGREPADFQSKPKQPFVLTAGRLWDQAKNLQALDRAAASIEWPVFAAGDRSTVSNIRTLGRLSAHELRAWLARASIYALPARYEPFGLSILEAAISGCALVLGDIPSLRENWDGAASFVSPDDHDALRTRIRDLIRNDEARRQLQHAARNRSSSFTASRMMQGYLARYAALPCRSHPATALRS